MWSISVTHILNYMINDNFDDLSYFKMNWSLLKKPKHLDTYSSCLIRGLSHKEKQIKYDSQT